MKEAELLKGAKEIAAFLGMSVEGTKKRIPTFKLGNNRYVRVSTLLGFIEAQEHAQLAAMNDNADQRRAA
jgi:hypothetical protein